MTLRKLKIRSKGFHVIECTLDGFDLLNSLTAINFRAGVDEATRVTLELFADVDYEGDPRLTIEATDPRCTDSICACGHGLSWHGTVETGCAHGDCSCTGFLGVRPCDGCHQVPCVCMVG